ncbi:unnamed protein product [Auanema sp. JU1783]|nr:unnamed protein product [Auanema sp. JU1783]
MEDALMLSVSKDSPSEYVPEEIMKDLQWLHDEAEVRMLTDSVKWVNEIIVHLPESWLNDYEKTTGNTTTRHSTSFSCSTRFFRMGKSMLETRDFVRAAYYLQKVQNENSVYKFIYYWSRYLGCVRDQLEHDAESFDKKAHSSNPDPPILAKDLLSDMLNDKKDHSDLHDSFINYLLARVQILLGMTEAGYETLKNVVKEEPRLWPAWEEMVNVIPKYEFTNVSDLCFSTNSIPWIFTWFTSLYCKRFQLFREGITRAETLLKIFGDLPQLLSLIGACYNHALDHRESVKYFKQVNELDPYRLEHMHLYSDSLFCKGERVALTALTHSFFKSHKFAWETCCIVGNYYNMRQEHQQAIRFFQRAARLNPTVASIWVLIGHEFLELKNNAGACLSYRRATEVDPVDFRGWYSLGQMYDILKMTTYSLYYYQQAHKCSPQDSRILVALGVAYAHIGRSKDAQKCFATAFEYGDVEGNALWHLAKLFEKANQLAKAARVYEEYLTTYDGTRLEEYDENATHIIRFLAKYYCGTGDLAKATEYAQRCLQHEATCEEGRAVLREVNQKNSAILMDVEATPARMEPNCQSSPTAMNMSDTDMAVSDGEDVSFD